MIPPATGQNAPADWPDGGKPLLRQRLIRLRESLTDEDCRRAAESLRPRLLEMLRVILPPPMADRPMRLGLYAAIRRELDLSPAWPDLQALPAELYFPAVQGRGAEARLVFGRVPDGCRPAEFLVPGRFGIAEPPPQSWLDITPELDVILMPGLGFDTQGNRLGWGKAFYDRLLAALPNKPVLIGIGYPFQILPRLPAEPTDRPVDWLLTPEGYFPAAGTAG